MTPSVPICVRRDRSDEWTSSQSASMTAVEPLGVSRQGRGPHQRRVWAVPGSRECAQTRRARRHSADDGDAIKYFVHYGKSEKYF